MLTTIEENLNSSMNDRAIASSSTIRWLMLCAVLVSTVGCATAELSQHAVDEGHTRAYRILYLTVELGKTTDSEHLSKRLLKVSKQYELEILPPTLVPAHHEVEPADAASLSIIELERHLIAGEHRQRYGRTSLTQMRGRKKHQRPVIKMRATLIDGPSARPVFEADYLAEGPWYADSETVAAAVAGSVLKQLGTDGFIISKIRDE